MAAAAIHAFALEYSFPNPNAPAVSQQLSTATSINFETNNLQVLSDNTHSSGTDIEGFLYVPTYAATDHCYNITANYIPKNITTIDSIPSVKSFQIAAFGPWTTPACVIEYLDQASQAQVSAFITYLPNMTNYGDYNAASPPNTSSPAWDLGDGGAWKSSYGFPVYALNSNDGSQVMNLLSNYSGTISSVPFGSQLVQQYGSSATVRVYMQAEVVSTSSLPSLWVFLLIVLAILIGFLLFASLAMRMVQRRRRRELRRMIANGEVNLETLGIARVKVSETILQKNPLYIYVEHGGTAGTPHAPTSDAITSAPVAASTSTTKKKKSSLFSSLTHPHSAKGTGASSRSTNSSNTITSVLPEKAVIFPQDSCVICLDEYTSHSTPVRWLPCSHVFHPACIDPLLRDYSSLCPICKASVLPKDYVPEVTNVMVRRERIQRRFRDMEARAQLQARRRGTATAAPGATAGGTGGAGEGGEATTPNHFRGLARFLPVQGQGTVLAQGSRVDGSGQAGTAEEPAVEMQPVGASAPRPGLAHSTSGASAANENARRPDGVSREEWARQRAEALLGVSETVEQEQQREEARRPRWRRIMGPVFPNLR